MPDTETQNSIFKPDYKISTLSGLGIIGFIVGCLLIFYDDFSSFRKTDSIFHEIVYRPRDYAKLFVGNKIDSLEKEIKYLGEQIKADTVTGSKKKDSLSNRYKADSIIRRNLAAYKNNYEDVAEVDTMAFEALNKAFHFQITPGLINKWDASFCARAHKWDTHSAEEDAYNYIDTIIVDSVGCYLKDSNIGFVIGGSVDIIAKRPHSDIDFITKYPAAGAWLLLVLILCSFCFIAIGTAIHLKQRVSKIFIEQKITGLSGSSYYWICFFTFSVIGLMALIWNLSFYDEDIVKNIFFMRHLDTSMKWVIVLGSIAGAFCLAGFIYTASMLSYFAKPLVKIRKEVSEKKMAIQQSQAINLAQGGTSPLTNPASAADQAALTEKEAEQTLQENIFNRLTKLFQTYFILAASILCLMVLCTGALFSTINSLDFIKLLASDWGYNPVRTDFIYLYGGLYTVILLLVYVPAKMRFVEVDIWNKAQPKEDSKWYDFLNPFGKIKDILVATSPLLVSLIQSLLDLLFK